MHAPVVDTSILLVRHGDTSEAAERRYPSGRDVPLSAHGRAQAAALVQAVQQVAIDAIFTSASRRARETAELLASTRQLPLQAHPALVEMNFGQLGGLTFDEAMSAFPDVVKRWLDNPFEVILPGGEVFLDFVSRVRRVRQQLSRTWAGRTIAVVSHGGVIAVWRCLEEGRPWSDFWRSIPAPGTGVWLIRTEGQMRVETLRPEV